MSKAVPGLDESAAVAKLMRFLAVAGITGQEKAIGRAVVDSLSEAGVPRRAIHFDRANEKIPLPTETGNLIVSLPGTESGRAGSVSDRSRLLFMTHLDTVPLCAGAVPVRKGNRIVPAGKTALGGDNRTGVACLVTMLATLLRHELPHPPLTVLFTVREESGLWGARFVDPDELGRPTMGFNVDGRSARDLTIGAVGAERWEVDIFGRAAHAGVHPEQGISATAVAALALADIYQNGWFGKITKDGRAGTSNVGSFGGANGQSAGEATNVVTDYVHIKGEARSHDSSFVREITAAYRAAFRRAGGKVVNDRGRAAKVRFQSRRDYYPFRLNDNSPVVRHAAAAARRAGWAAALRISNGGLDANWTVRHGIPTVTIGAGQHEIHTVDEYVDIPEFIEGCRLALTLATEAAEVQKL